MSTPQVSVLLPTVRPDLYKQAVASVGPAAEEVTYEVVVVADFVGPEPNITGSGLDRRIDLTYKDPVSQWIISGRRGPVEAVNIAAKWASGEYLFLLNDEATLSAGALARLYHSAICQPDAIFSPIHRPPYKFTYYNKPFVPFPFAHRDVFAKLGGLLDPAYKAFYADPDLGLRADAAGVALRTIDGSVITHHNGHDEAKQANVSQYMALDQRTFRDRWDHLGEFHDC